MYSAACTIRNTISISTGASTTSSMTLLLPRSSGGGHLRRLSFDVIGLRGVRARSVGGDRVGFRRHLVVDDRADGDGHRDADRDQDDPLHRIAAFRVAAANPGAQRGE